MKSQLVAGTILLLLLAAPAQAGFFGDLLSGISSFFDDIGGLLFGFKPDAESLCFESTALQYQSRISSLNRQVAEQAYGDFESCKQNPPEGQGKDCGRKPRLQEICETIKEQCPSLAASMKGTPGAEDACDIALGMCNKAVKKNYGHCKS